MSDQEESLAVIDMSSVTWEQFQLAQHSFLHQLCAHAEDGEIPGLHRSKSWSVRRAFGHWKLHWRIVLQRDDIKDKIFSIELLKGNHNHPMLASFLCQVSDFEESSWLERNNIWQHADVKGIDVIEVAISAFQDLFENRMYDFFTRNCQHYTNNVLTDLGTHRHWTSCEQAGGVFGAMFLSGAFLCASAMLSKYVCEQKDVDEEHPEKKGESENGDNNKNDRKNNRRCQGRVQDVF
eukprot:TRINITY_DN1234_c0_g1_i5.p2 TRINITY_DN1234_c0_g1~~TRINITY_DN1234_c0_g1_i5.p2  ORF type:complete len:236 (-),score=25.41 TRINITY_DN1234_c0_g1_i5:995-1702(-)